MSTKLSNLSKGFASLTRMAKELHLEERAKPKLEATPEEVKVSRLTPQRIHLLRNKIGISQKDLGTLLEVSIGTVGLWEKGKFAPSAQKKAALIALRKLGKREVKKLLAEKKQELKAKGEKAAAKKPAGKRAAAPKKKPAKAKPARKK